jgi:hypothetical protein
MDSACRTCLVAAAPERAPPNCKPLAPVRWTAGVEGVHGLRVGRTDGCGIEFDATAVVAVERVPATLMRH